MTYLLLRDLHVLLAGTSIAGFALRGALMLRGSPVLGTRWVRTAPHVLDTALLLSGVTLAVGLGVSPLEQPWLAAKLAAIAAYVVLGSVALRRGRTPRVRALALVLALLAAGYVVVTALGRDPVPW